MYVAIWLTLKLTNLTNTHSFNRGQISGGSRGHLHPKGWHRVPVTERQQRHASEGKGSIWRRKTTKNVSKYRFSMINELQKDETLSQDSRYDFSGISGLRAGTQIMYCPGWEIIAALFGFLFLIPVFISQFFSFLTGQSWGYYPLVMTDIAIENGPFIVELPINHGDY